MKILLIEDDDLDAVIVTRSLANAFADVELRHSKCLQAALDCLREETCGFDVILSDLSLPDSIGLEAIFAIQKVCPDCPLIVLTGNENPTQSLKAIANGAQDYLEKNKIAADSLKRSIQHSIERHSLKQKNTRLLSTLRQSGLLLHEKNRKLEKACKTAQQFVDNVSHEFRTPLTVIMEYASLISDSMAGPVTAEQSKLLGIIDDRASDLNNMVDDMLDVSKLESGLLSASRCRCNVEDIIEHVLPAIRRKADIRDVTIELQIDEDLPCVYCDASKAGRVIINLAVNAIKFSRPPGKVTLFARMDSPDDIVIGLADNGIGIPLKRQKEIFQRFSQVRSELNEETKGFGLGLNIAQEIVDLNLGRMRVESTEGVGSTFSFTLPIDQPEEITRRLIDRRKWGNEEGETLSAIQIRTDDTGDENESLELEHFLIHVLRQYDLLFPIDHHTWLLIVSAPSIALDDFFSRLETQRNLINRNRPRGPLPDFRSEVLGSWQTSHNCHSLIDLVHRRCHTEECIGV